MKVLSKEKFKVLAEANGWSLDHAKGYVDGETFRLRGKRPLKYVLIGIDEYCLGAGIGGWTASRLGADPSRVMDAKSSSTLIGMFG
jgi:hypothetical protein